MNDSSRLMKTAAVVSVIFAVISTVSICFAASLPGEYTMQEGMLRRLTEKTVMTDEVSNREGDRSGYLTIPLPDGIGWDNISITSDDAEQKIKIEISEVPAYFYHRNFFSGDMKNIQNIRYGYENQVALIELDTDGIFSPDTEVENGNLYLGLKAMQDVYKLVVAIDAGHGGNEEGTVAYGVSEKEIAEKCSEALAVSLESHNVKTFLTHSPDTTANTAERLEAASSVSADIIISFHTNADSKTRVTHGVQVVSQKENLEKAESMENVLSEQLGLSHAEENEGDMPDLISEADCPVYYIRLGYLTNKAEAEKMSADGFAEQTAEALTAFLLSDDHETVSGNK